MEEAGLRVSVDAFITRVLEVAFGMGRAGYSIAIDPLIDEVIQSLEGDE